MASPMQNRWNALTIQHSDWSSALPFPRLCQDLCHAETEILSFLTNAARRPPCAKNYLSRELVCYNPVAILILGIQEIFMVPKSPSRIFMWQFQFQSFWNSNNSFLSRLYQKYFEKVQCQQSNDFTGPSRLELFFSWFLTFITDLIPLFVY